MKAKWVLVSAAVLCVVFAMQVSFGQPQERAERPARAAAGGMMGAGMFEGLDLTQEQQAKMAEIRESMMEKIRNADSAEARQEIFGQMREQMQNVLTEEQRAKMRERFSRPADGERPAGERPAARGDQARPSAEAARVRPMDPLQLFDAVAPRLELTEEQQAKIGKLREEAIKKLLNDIKALLTEDQKARLTQAHERLRAAQSRPRAEAAAEKPEAAAARREARREGAEGERTRTEGARPQRPAGERQREQ